MAVKRFRRALPRRRARRLERRTLGLGLLGLGTTASVVAGELAYVWRRGSAPLPAETDDLLGAAAEAARQAGEVAREGYIAASDRENALFNLLLAYTLTFAVVRAGTWTIHTRGSLGPIRNVVLHRRHIHHFVPGIGLAFLAGGASVVSADEALDRWLAIPFGTGVALTLDESALLLQLEDVYWREEGILSVQIALSAMTLLSSLALARRFLRRGEQRVLPADGA